MKDSHPFTKRKVYASVPSKVEYSLTSLGQSLKSVIKSLERWGECYKDLS
ncbi:helix-turn-helix domain-containing protein [Helicobacter sp. MIT 14-3879]|nr:winged helix-turn-helix transcriptional regulator [Helicobacter sp. MIT 14-3879]RDU61662.1 hypothetical protein CQA44_08435 [Helicobacter sp. MIT 14-3879]